MRKKMQSRDFCFWLQGFLEMSNSKTLDENQTQMLKNHLNLVFIHDIDPSMPDPTGKLQEVHDGNAQAAHELMNRPPGARC